MTTTPSPEAVALASKLYGTPMPHNEMCQLIDAALTAAKNKALTDLAEVCENAMALANKAGG